MTIAKLFGGSVLVTVFAIGCSAEAAPRSVVASAGANAARVMAASQAAMARSSAIGGPAKNVSVLKGQRLLRPL